MLTDWNAHANFISSKSIQANSINLGHSQAQASCYLLPFPTNPFTTVFTSTHLASTTKPPTRYNGACQHNCDTTATITTTLTTTITATLTITTTYLHCCTKLHAMNPRSISPSQYSVARCWHPAKYNLYHILLLYFIFYIRGCSQITLFSLEPSLTDPPPLSSCVNFWITPHMRF